MRKFLISNNKKFVGEVGIVYDGYKHLAVVDFQRSALDIETKAAMLRSLPLDLDGFLGAKWCSNDTMVVESTYTVEFDNFWQAYKKKINKSRCLPIWNKLSTTEQIAAVEGIAAYDRYLRREDWRGKMDPENFLKNKSWQNEWR